MEGGGRRAEGKTSSALCVLRSALRFTNQIAAAYTTATKIHVGLNTAAHDSEDADGQQRNRDAAPERHRNKSHAHDAVAGRNREAEERAVEDARLQRMAVERHAPARPVRDAARNLR